MLCAGSAKTASEIFTHAVLQLVFVRKTASSECILQGAKKDGNRRVQNRDCKEDEGEKSTHLLQLPPLCPDWCAVWRCHAEGLDSGSCLAGPIEFVVLTSLMFAHIALNWLWHLSSRICKGCTNDICKLIATAITVSGKQHSRCYFHTDLRKSTPSLRFWRKHR